MRLFLRENNKQNFPVRGFFVTIKDMLFGRKTLFSAVTILSIVGYGIFVFAAAPLGGYAPGETLDPIDCSPGDTDCKVKMFLSTTLPGSIDVKYEQTDDFLGLGIPAAGQTWDAGTGGVSLIATIDGTLTGGFKNQTHVGYLTLGGPGATANMMAFYDDINDESSVTLDTSNLNGDGASIEISAKSSGSNIRFLFNGSNTYTFPTTNPSSGEVLGYTGANQLGWVAGSDLVIGGAINGSASNQVLFTNTSGILSQSSGFNFDDATKAFSVGDLLVSANGTIFSLDDSTGDIQARTNEAFNVYAVANSSPYLSVDIANSTYLFGALGNGNETHLSINDNNGRVFLGTHPFGNPNASYLNIDPLNVATSLVMPFGYTGIGAPGIGNGTSISIDDYANKSIYLNADQVRVVGNNQTRISLILDNINDLYILGDGNNVVNSTAIKVDDVAKVVTAVAGTGFVVSDTSSNTIVDVSTQFSAITLGGSAWNSGLKIDSPSSMAQLGDVFSSGNGTVLKVDDTSMAITFDYATDRYTFPVGDGTTDYLLATDGSGQLFWQDPTMVPSDQSLKSNINTLLYGLDTLMQLNPVSYTMNSTGKEQIGFIAQDVESLIPELVGEVANSKKGLAYGQMTAVIVKSVQEMNLKITDIENFASAENTTFLQNLIAWLGDTANGLTTLFAGQVNTHELCVDGQCLNQDDVRQLIELKNQMHRGISDGFGYGYGN